MDDIYRRLGREHQHDLLRDAERLRRGTHARSARRVQQGHGLALRVALRTTRESLREMWRRVGGGLRPARG